MGISATLTKGCGNRSIRFDRGKQISLQVLKEIERQVTPNQPDLDVLGHGATQTAFATTIHSRWRMNMTAPSKTLLRLGQSNRVDVTEAVFAA